MGQLGTLMWIKLQNLLKFKPRSGDVLRTGPLRGKRRGVLLLSRLFSPSQGMNVGGDGADIFLAKALAPSGHDAET